ncbi:MAG: type IV pili methyl-accepting chemotaxis transducer N-terminal domain-containing protein [Formivibrio sp.]|nr:type IV pili methyl-accepting chemotaxis transducer N-terminal domain-containing protein [Formivibrio sp.]
MIPVNSSHSIPMDAEFPEIPAHQRISTRIVAASFIALAVVLTMVGGTLWLSWQLEGGAAAINDAGSLRMRSYKLALALDTVSSKGQGAAREDLRQLDITLEGLRRGDPSRPLFLPEKPAIRTQYQVVTTIWQQKMRPFALATLAGDPAAILAYRQAVDDFVSEINNLVFLIEHDNAHKTTLLRLSQAVLIAMSILGTVMMIYLLYLWIIRPVVHLRNGIQRMAAREFDVVLPVETHDEFGVLAEGFNSMAAELASLYHGLEARVHEKTAQLAAQNRELSALYDITAFLSIPASIEKLCQGFLSRLMQLSGADGCSVRISDPDGDNIRIVVSAGLPLKLVNEEQCLKAHECLCGQALREGVLEIRDFRHLPHPQAYRCEEAGFSGICIFQVASPQSTLGTFALHFRNEHILAPAEKQLLETLGQHLGLAIENIQLSAKERQLAILEERNLVAQGLHDSIAQSLNFLNMQVQMLEGALSRQSLTDARQIVPLLHAGVEESYNDVRELLLNFRSRLEVGQLEISLQKTLNKFSQQTGIQVSLESTGNGAPLLPEQQLQVLFIVQEALSNIRKHALASNVSLHINNQHEYTLDIADNGQGFDQAQQTKQNEKHVGLAIMQERATRLAATLNVDSAPGQGTRLHLVVPRASTAVHQGKS